MNDSQTKGELRQAIRGGLVKCHYCDDVAVNIDHAIPRARGGQDSKDNWRPSCQKCNERKGDFTEREWLGLDLPIICNCWKPFNTVAARDKHLLKKKCKASFRCSECLRHFVDIGAVTQHIRDRGCNSDLSPLVDTSGFDTRRSRLDRRLRNPVGTVSRT